MVDASPNVPDSSGGGDFDSCPSTSPHHTTTLLPCPFPTTPPRAYRAFCPSPTCTHTAFAFTPTHFFFLPFSLPLPNKPPYSSNLCMCVHTGRVHGGRQGLSGCGTPAGLFLLLPPSPAWTPLSLSPLLSLLPIVPGLALAVPACRHSTPAYTHLGQEDLDLFCIFAWLPPHLPP